MNDTTQILVLAAVVVGCAAAGFVWLWNRRVRGLRALAAYMRGKGMDVETLEAGLVDEPRHGPMLAVSLLPSDGAFSCGINAIEENVQSAISFLVRNKYTRDANWLQITVNVKSGDCSHVLVKFWCDEIRLRELEQHCHPFSRSIMRMPFFDVVSGCSPRGVPVDGYREWCYKVDVRSADEVEVALYRLGEDASRFSLSLCKAEPIPVGLLRDEASNLEFAIQRQLNARLYALKDVPLCNDDGGPQVFGICEPNIYVLRYIREFAFAGTGATDVGWLLPARHASALIETIKNEGVGVLEVRRYAADAPRVRWCEDGVVWKTDDMRSPTRGILAAGLHGLDSAMKREFASCADDKSYYFIFDCRMVQSFSPLAKGNENGVVK